MKLEAFVSSVMLLSVDASARLNYCGTFYSPDETSTPTGLSIPTSVSFAGLLVF